MEPGRTKEAGWNREEKEKKEKTKANTDKGKAAQAETAIDTNANPNQSAEFQEAAAQQAWRRLLEEAGEKLGSARTLGKAAWQRWADDWRASGGTIEDAARVGRYVRLGGLDWLKKPKIAWITSKWNVVLAQSLEDKRTKKQAQEPTSAQQVFAKTYWADKLPPEAIEALEKAGLRRKNNNE
jgi:hypothetical protein